MVSFVSISTGVFFVSIVLIGTSHAVPPLSEAPSHLSQDSAGNPGNITLPSFIASRTQVSGIDYTGMVQRGDIKTLNRMILDLPENIRAASEKNLQSRLDANLGNSMILASPSQLTDHKYYAGIAATAYCRAVTGLGLWTCKNCQTFVPDGQMVYRFNTPVHDTTGFILKSDSQKTINLVFRGTNSLRQTILDLVMIKKDYTPAFGTQVHAGFYNSFLEVADEYFPYLQREIILHPDYKVVVSGHSLGGVQALFAALDLYQRDSRFNTKNLSVYTVGSPRVGDANFANYVKSTGIPYYRSVHDRDVAPHVPAQELGYLHAGIEIWDLPGYGAHICTSELESPYCSNSIAPATHILDHLTYYGINEGLCL
ncbi:lipase [Mucor mucedo]|uniref:lipase n=1 Tax=Mucor mucedo TaxID=29922 RepID=UPI00221EF549|nr:lipase [Mucor mucedo]KAI7892788.1 lipase [Mucor mucedo]